MRVAVSTMRPSTLSMSVSSARSRCKLSNVSSCVAAVCVDIAAMLGHVFSLARGSALLFRMLAGDGARDLAHRVERVDLAHRLVRSQPDDARETHRVAGVMPIGLLHLIEGDLDDGVGANDAQPTEVLDRCREEVLRHLRDLLVCEPRVRL